MQCGKIRSDHNATCQVIQQQVFARGCTVFLHRAPSLSSRQVININENLPNARCQHVTIMCLSFFNWLWSCMREAYFQKPRNTPNSSNETFAQLWTKIFAFFGAPKSLRQNLIWASLWQRLQRVLNHSSFGTPAPVLIMFPWVAIGFNGEVAKPILWNPDCVMNPNKAIRIWK